MWLIQGAEVICSCQHSSAAPDHLGEHRVKALLSLVVRRFVLKVPFAQLWAEAQQVFHRFPTRLPLCLEVLEGHRSYDTSRFEQRELLEVNPAISEVLIDLQLICQDD